MKTRNIIAAFVIVVIIVTGLFVFFYVPMVQSASSKGIAGGQSETVSYSCLIFHVGMTKSSNSFLYTNNTSIKWSNKC
jgi:hypothetical protein